MLKRYGIFIGSRREERFFYSSRRKLPEEIKKISRPQEKFSKKIFHVNEDWIVFFPKNQAVDEKIVRYKLLGDYLKLKTTLPFPEISFSGSRVSVYGYKQIKGAMLTKERYANLLSKTKLHKEVADFLHALHRSIDQETAKTLGFKNYIFPSLANFETYETLLDLDPSSKSLVQKRGGGLSKAH